ncbi:hypothetical protein [Acetobacter sp. P5B1]|uniref:hypothetical protein n=1 Tax=Acetobacter sp. P5B1 TaxID=2762620 RepID=UPI001C058019|nr:hypothetical protein [Acetobacter sp. P5B1]
MSEENPKRVIAYSLTGPVYADESMSDEDVARLRKSLSGPLSANQSDPLAAHRERERLAKLVCHELLKVLKPDDFHQFQGSQSQRSLPSFARLGLLFREPAKRARTSFQGKVFSHRISMVVVAIAMVVGLRALVNLRSQHTRTDGGVRQ